jgi:hypothetical protein
MAAGIRPVLGARLANFFSHEKQPYQGNTCAPWAFLFLPRDAANSAITFVKIAEQAAMHN